MYSNFPTLIRQALTISCHAYLSNWSPLNFLKWGSKLDKLLKASGGARQVGCFGLNPHAVWEVTHKCNLNCLHCHARGHGISGALTFNEGLALIRQIHELGIKTLVFSGGEPLLREDLFDLIKEARDRGLDCFLATNGTLINRRVARLLKRLDVGVVVSLDSIEPRVHDLIRGVPGSYYMVMEGIRNSLKEDLYLHINTVVTRLNRTGVWKVLKFGDDIGVYSFFIYVFKPIGRGYLRRELALSPEELKALVQGLAKAQRVIKSLIIPVGLPQYWAQLARCRGISSVSTLKALGLFLCGCLADKGMVYIKHNGDVWPCPFIPVKLGNVASGQSLSSVLSALKARLPISRLCEACTYRYICGGCKADILLERGYKA